MLDLLSCRKQGRLQSNARYFKKNMIVDFAHVNDACFPFHNSCTGVWYCIGYIQAMRQVVHRACGDNPQDAFRADQTLGNRMNCSVSSGDIRFSVTVDMPEVGFTIITAFILFAPFVIHSRLVERSSLSIVPVGIQNHVYSPERHSREVSTSRHTADVNMLQYVSVRLAISDCQGCARAVGKA